MAAGSGVSAFVTFEHVQKSYDGETLVVKDLNLRIGSGEFLTMLGPSGSGKTTCLMMLAGFETNKSTGTESIACAYDQQLVFQENFYWTDTMLATGHKSKQRRTY